jgi:hypothetical protein
LYVNQNTISFFLKGLTEDQFSRVPKAIQQWHTAESEGWFGLGNAEQKVKLKELRVLINAMVGRPPPKATGPPKAHQSDFQV